MGGIMVRRHARLGAASSAKIPAGARGGVSVRCASSPHVRDQGLNNLR